MLLRPASPDVQPRSRRISRRFLRDLDAQLIDGAFAKTEANARCSHAADSRFLEWLAARPRPYSEVMDAWRTSCPRLTVWEDTHDRGFVTQRRANSGESLIELTTSGREFLAENRRSTVALQSEEDS